MQPIAGFWAFVWSCIKAAEEATRALFGLNVKTVLVGALLLILGFILFRIRRGKDKTKEKIEDYLLISFVPIVVFVVLLSVLNLVRAPYLVYTAAYAKAKQNLNTAHEHLATLEQEKANLTTQLEQEKNRSQPKFEIFTGSTCVAKGTADYGQIKEPLTFIVLAVTIFNHGAPSVIRNISMSVGFPDGTGLTGHAYLPMNGKIEMPGPKGKISFARSSSLFMKGATPIPTGGQADGFVMFKFPGGLMEKIGRTADWIQLTIFDVNNNTYTERLPRNATPTKEFGMTPGMLESR